VAIHQDIAAARASTAALGATWLCTAVRRHDVDGLVVAKLDRLSRSVIDAARTIEAAQRDGWTVVLLDVGVDLSTAHGEAMANMTATFAQLERRLIGARTRAALAVKRAQGVRLGRPRSLAVPVVERIAPERAAGASLQTIADQLRGGHCDGAWGLAVRRCTITRSWRASATTRSPWPPGRPESVTDPSIRDIRARVVPGWACGPGRGGVSLGCG
jgi:DNA invertase Pin-like site-specific DNA recombinase